MVFKVYSDWSIKKLFKMFLDPKNRPIDNMTKLRNRLIHRRQNVGTIYVVQQGRHGLFLEVFMNGIGESGWKDNKGREPKYLNFEELDYVIKVTNKNRPIKATWFKIRK